MNIYWKKLKECEENLGILIDKYDYLSYQLEKTHKTLKMINDDLDADRQAEDAYNSAREVEEFAKKRHAEQMKIMESKFGKISDLEPETVADDILRAAGWTKEDLQKGA